MTNEVKLIHLLKNIKEARGIKGDVFFPVAMETLADGIGCSKKTIYNTIRRLEYKGYIETEQGDHNEGTPKKYKVVKEMSEEAIQGSKFKSRIKVGDVEFDVLVESNDEVIDIINKLKGGKAQTNPVNRQTVVPNVKKEGNEKVDAIADYVSNLEGKIVPMLEEVKETNDKELAQKVIDLIESNKAKEPWNRVNDVIKEYGEVLSPKQISFLKARGKDIERWFAERETTIKNLNKLIKKHNY